MLRSSVVLLNAVKQSKILLQQRMLYAPSTMGIDSFELTRSKIKSQFASEPVENKFKTKMEEYIETKPGQMVFTEDLKTMVHIANSKEDVDLVIKMIKKYNNQFKEIKYGNYVFGPVIYRMFYYLKETDAALSCFKDPELNGLFNQMITYQILMDMLYSSGRYQDGLDVFDLIRSQLKNSKFPKHAVLLAIACCYKLNTPESFKYCTSLWQELMDANHIPMRKTSTFAAALALAQKSPQIALEILSTIRDQQYVTVRNIKVIAYAESGRPDTAVEILRSLIDVDEPITKTRSCLQQTLQIVENSIQNTSDKKLYEDFKKIERILIDSNQVAENSLDDILGHEIMFTSFNNKNPENKSRTFVASSFARGNQRNFRPSNRSPIRANLSDSY